MGVESPTTYGDYYWAKQVEAAKLFAEDTEDILSGYARGLIADFGFIEELPRSMRSLFDGLSEPPSFGLAEVLARFTSEIADSSVSSGVSPILRSIGYAANKHFRSKKVPFAQAALLYQRKKVSEPFFEDCYGSEGYYDIDAAIAYDSMKPYPSVPDLVLYSRYHGDPNAPWGEMEKHFDIDPVDWPIWKWLGLQRLTTMQVQTLYRRGLISSGDLLNKLAEIGWTPTDRPHIEELGWTTPNAMLLVQGDLQQRKSTDEVIRDISFADINPKWADKYLDAILTKPSSADIVAYELRRDPTLAGLPSRLRQIGIHSEYFDTYKTLAYPIPPVADIITMAVREAFTPAIAERFGQYEDYPPEFEEWALKKGLSTEWSKRYWAAHWSLPSAQQGFEMLHRGVVNRDELDMLLRALDVMPFWRTKLTQIAYRRLTRVDVRRMYKAGVLSKAEVYEAYLQHGYTEENARRMTDFTVQWAMPKEASITRSDILTAYKNRMITRPEASDLLADMGEEYFHREFMLRAVDYKKGLELTENKIKGIRNLYKRRIYDDNKTIDELLKLDLPTEEVEDLMAQWYYEVKAEPTRHWTTAQVLSFVKEGLITKERGIAELAEIGYDEEHIAVYMRSGE